MVTGLWPSCCCRCCCEAGEVEGAAARTVRFPPKAGGAGVDPGEACAVPAALGQGSSAGEEGGSCTGVIDTDGEDEEAEGGEIGTTAEDFLDGLSPFSHSSLHIFRFLDLVTGPPSAGLGARVRMAPRYSNGRCCCCCCRRSCCCCCGKSGVIDTGGETGCCRAERELGLGGGDDGGGGGVTAEAGMCGRSNGWDGRRR